MIYSFKNDYSSIAHPLVIKKLIECQNEQNVGYGLDFHTENAKLLIQDKIKRDSNIYFLTGGTQTNMITISSVLKPYEAVICADTGHINVHETGAIEGQGHKVLSIPTINGKLTVAMIDSIVNKHIDCHMVLPKMVYISNATETGLVYNKEEIIDIYNYCQNNNLYLFIDGARLASALAASNTTYEDYGKYCDMFYIGGTKNGGYIGEALVINNKELAINFEYAIKHFGGMLAKGFVAAIVFEVLMEQNIYLNIGKKENECAMYIQEKLKNTGINFHTESVTNQIFPILNNDILDALYEDFPFEVWEKLDDKQSVVRFVTSFTTTKHHCDLLVSKIISLLSQ